MTRRQTITVNSTPGDATASAEIVATNLRGTGAVVTIGQEYTQPYGHKAGMLSVDLTIEDPPSVGEKTYQVVPEATIAPTPPLDEISRVIDVATTETAEVVPFSDGPDMSKEPDATDDDGYISPKRRRSRASA